MPAANLPPYAGRDGVGLFIVMNSNKWKWIQAIGQAVVAAITALLTALTASACSPGLAPAVALALA
jgi:hypothetical protein